MTPIIFLDFDGVLNGYADPCDGGLRGLDPARVARLNRIVKATGAHVVVTSAWRRIHSRSELGHILAAKGFIGSVVSTTPRFQSGARGAEIESWIQHSPMRYLRTPFVILDDDAYDLGEMSDRLVRTDPILGLTEADADRCIEMLGGKR